MGRRVGSYEVLGELARGGMGVVYRARELSTGREVALKEVFDPDERFALEAEAIARLNHPGIVRVHGFDPTAQPPFLVMELIEGESLQQRIQGGGLAVEELLHLGAQLCEALAHAHAQGVLHRDLKPANVLIGADGAPKLTDFGLGKVIDQSQHLTQTGEILGTPAYMAPEQAAGLVHEVGVAADVYGLGATLYAALTGRPPFPQRGMVEVLYAVLNKPPAPPSRSRPGVPAWLDRVLLRCLEKRPGRRYADANALGEALAAGPAGRGDSAGRALVAGVAALAVVCLVALTLAWTRRPLPPPRSPAVSSPEVESPEPVEPELAGDPSATPLVPRLWRHAVDGMVGVAFDGAQRLWTVGSERLRLWDLRDLRVLVDERLPDAGSILARAGSGAVYVALSDGQGVYRFDGTQGEVLHAELESVYAIALDPGGETLAICTRRGLYVSRGGATAQPLDLSSGLWDEPGFSADGKRLVAICKPSRDEKQVVLWDLEAGSVLARRPFPVLANRSLRMAALTGADELLQATSDGQLEFLGDEGISQRLISGGESRGSATGLAHWGSPRGLHIRGDRLVSLAERNDVARAARGGPGTLGAWDLERRRSIGAPSAVDVAGPRSLAVTPDGRWAAVGGCGGQVQLVRVPQDPPVPPPWRVPVPESSRGVWVAFDGLGRLVTASRQALRAWDPWTHTELREVDLPGGGDIRLAWGASGGLVARRGQGSAVWVEPDEQAPPRPLDGVRARRVVASAGDGPYAIESDARVGLLRPGWPPEWLDVGGAVDRRGGMGFSPGGTLLALTAGLSEDEDEDEAASKRLVVVDVAARAVREAFPILHRGRALAFDGQRVFVGTSLGQLFVYDLREARGRPSEAAARWLRADQLTAWVDPAVKPTPGLVGLAHPGSEVLALALGGRRLYSLGAPEDGSSGEVKVWALSDGRLLRRIPLDFRPEVQSLAVSPDGHWLAVGGRGAEALLLSTRDE